MQRGTPCREARLQPMGRRRVRDLPRGTRITCTALEDEQKPAHWHFFQGVTIQVQVGMFSITYAALESGAPPGSFLPLRESKRHTEEHTPSRLRALDWMKSCELLGSSVCYLTGPDGLQPANDRSRRLFSAGFIFDVSLSSCCSVAFSKSLTSA